jgi:TatD DNase family protein
MPSDAAFSKTEPPFVDIHTHRRNVSAGVISVTNFSQKEFKNGLYTEGSSCASVGLHPWFLTEDNFEKDAGKLSQLINNQEVITIGECGLDKLKGENLAFQTQAFEAQIRLAESVGKPVVIHCVRAFGEVVAVKKRLKPSVPLIIHGFNKNQNILNELLSNDFFISIGAAILPKKGVSRISGWQNAPYTEGSFFSDVLKKIPLDRLFFETDAADNVAISEIYDAAATVLGMDVTDLKSIIYKNFESLKT